MIQEDIIAKINYDEALKYPHFVKSLDNVLCKYQSIITDHHVKNINELNVIVNKALEEGNGILIIPEYCGYIISVWKEHL